MGKYQFLGPKKISDSDICKLKFNNVIPLCK